MPKYRVNLFYHGSAAYDVEVADEEAALEEAKRLNNLEFTDSDVYEDKEE